MVGCAVNRPAQTDFSTALPVLKSEAQKSDTLASFPPGYFALTMATGIVSLAVDYHGWKTIARVFLALNIVAYLTLWALTLIRFIRYPARLIHDLTHHFHSAAFLTIVAGTCVLGCQFAILTPWISVAKALWFAGTAFWIVLSYTFFAVITMRNPKPPLEAGINGVWLLAVVATESVSALGIVVAPFFVRTELALFFSLTVCLVGAMFYLFFITLILYRWMFFPIRPEKMTPDYWINMGATAIATLSGALLLSATARWNLLQNLTPFLMGFTLAFWAMATWWIPVLLLVGLWRHGIHRVPLSYSPDYWSLVFPLGMYSAATFLLVKITGLTFLNSLAAIFAYAALIAWSIVFLGMIRNLARKLWRMGLFSESPRTLTTAERMGGL